MPIASFRNKVFQVSASKIYTFNDLAWSGSLDTESQEKLQDKPSTYIKGDGLQSMSLSIPLRRGMGVDMRGEIESWESIKSGAVPDFFILGGKPLGKNKWLLKSVDVSDTQFDGNGQMIKATLKLEFEEYVRAGKATPSKGNTATVSANLTPASYIPGPEAKAEEKRNNPNSKEARIARVNSMYSLGV